MIITMIMKRFINMLFKKSRITPRLITQITLMASTLIYLLTSYRPQEIRKHRLMTSSKNLSESFTPNNHVISAVRPHDASKTLLLSSFIQNLPVNQEINCDDFYQKETFPKKNKKIFYQEQNNVEDFNTTKVCSDLQTYGFKILPVGDQELNHPIAFSVLVYKDAAQATRLLRAIYRPHNVYCIHVDIKANSTFYTHMLKLIGCLENVFLAPSRVDVKWGKFTVLEPEVICMRSLLRHKVMWKSWINLTGQEFPLKTNLELVSILEVLNGTNDIPIDKCDAKVTGNSSEECKHFTKNGWLERVGKHAPAPPSGIQLYKGTVHTVLSYDFVHFLITSESAQAFLQWLKTAVRVPDEFYFPTINFNRHLNAPGSNTRLIKDISRLKFWRRFEYKHCLKMVRYICILSLQELPLLTTSRQLFANKFFQDFSPLGYSCLERWYFLKVYKEVTTGQIDIDLDYYRNNIARNYL